MKILFVTKNAPYPVKGGSSQRTAILIDALSQIGEVSLFFIGTPLRKEILEKKGYRVAAAAEPCRQKRDFKGVILEKLFGNTGNKLWRTLAGVKVDFTPDPCLNERLLELLRQEKFDLIVGRYLIPSAQAGLFEPGMPPVIVDVDDVNSKSATALIQSPASGLVMRKIMQYRLKEIVKYESMLWAKATRLWFPNSEDLLLVDSGAADLVPNIPYDILGKSDLSSSAKDSQIVLWVGSFDHRVNLEGVDYFLKMAWMKIKNTKPEAIFRIVGSHLTESVKNRWQEIEGVEVIGYAENLYPHYRDAALSVVPLMDGAGTKIKILESLAYKRTCVITRHSLKGYEGLLHDEQCVRISEDVDGLVQPIVYLLNNPQLRWQMEEAGRSIIENNFTRQTVSRYIMNSVTSLYNKERV
ncbi:MAG: glycosyltransferase family 4 protein [Candidatus Sedimenticola sp. (ex Thyasira tokunagai)]